MKSGFYRSTMLIDDMEINCLFFEMRHNREWKEECQRLGYAVFELRHSSEDWSVPCCIENKVVVDFWGYMAVRSQDGAQFLSEWIAEEEFLTMDDCTFLGWEFTGCEDVPSR